MVYRDDWNEVEIGELGEIITGQTPKTSISENYGGNLMFLTPSDDMDKRYVTDTNRKLTQLGAKSVKNKIIPPNSICVSCIGSQLGKVVITTEQTVTNQQINTIIPNDKTDYMYLYYAMKIVGKRLNHLSKTSTAVPIINKTVFSSEKILLPPLKEQIAIAKLLSSLDDKIENNKAIIANLEAQAQAIFKSWFIDFEPFQDGEFVDSELGLIPEGWEVKALGQLINFDIGGGWGKAKPDEKHTIPAYVIRGADIPNARLGNLNKENYRYHTPTNLSKRKLEYGDIIFESSGGSPTQDLGRMLYISNSLLEDYGEDVIPASFCKLIRIENPYTRWYIYNLLEYALKMRYLTKYEVKSTGISNFAFKVFKEDFKVVVPPKNELLNFHVITYNNIKLCANLGVTNQILAQLRDTLLPKLMSGEIRVGQDDIEEIENLL